MAHAQQSHFKVVLHLHRQLEQTQGVGHRCALLANAVGHGFLGEMAFLDEALVAEGGFDGIQILPLDILHKGHLQHALVVRFADVCGNHTHAGHTARLETAFAADYLVAVFGDLAHRDGLDEPEGADAGGQFFQGLRIKRAAGLERVGFHHVHGDAEHVGSAGGGFASRHILVHIAYRLAELVGFFAEKGAEAAPETMLLFCHIILPGCRSFQAIPLPD